MTELKREDVVALFDRRRKAWLENDEEAYMALWAEDMTIELPGHADPIVGREAYASLIAQSTKNMRPISWEFHSLALDGDRVLAAWTLSGEFRATGKTHSWRGMSICRLESGLIKEWREYWDPASLRS
jgi:uncharacterized protein (TIGR02246 family)